MRRILDWFWFAFSAFIAVLDVALFTLDCTLKLYAGAVIFFFTSLLMSWVTVARWDQIHAKKNE